MILDYDGYVDKRLWHIDQAEGMPSVDFIDIDDTHGRVVLTFKAMPTAKGLETILEVTENAIDAINRHPESKRHLILEYHLPVDYHASS